MKPISPYFKRPLNPYVGEPAHPLEKAVKPKEDMVLVEVPRKQKKKYVLVKRQPRQTRQQPVQPLIPLKDLRHLKKLKKAKPAVHFAASKLGKALGFKKSDKMKKLEKEYREFKEEKGYQKPDSKKWKPIYSIKED